MTHIIIGISIFAAALACQIGNYAYLRVWRKANNDLVQKAKKQHGSNATISFNGHARLHNLSVIAMAAGLLYFVVALVFYLVK